MTDTFSIACIAGLIVFCVWLVYAERQNTKECKARGGHIVSVYKGRLCVSADGRIMEW